MKNFENISSPEFSGTPQFYSERLTALLPVERTQLRIPGRVQQAAGEAGLAPKSEFHITLVTFATGASIAEALGGFDVITLEQQRALRQIWEGQPVQFELLDEIYQISKHYDEVEIEMKGETVLVPEHTRTSIIQAVNVPSLEERYQATEKLIRADLSRPWPHVTLYASQPVLPGLFPGIAVSSYEAFLEMNPKRL